MSVFRLSIGLACVVLFMNACDQTPRTNDPDQAALAQRDVEPRTLEGGLVIHDLTIGAGPAAERDSTVEINFVAMFADGTEWDSSAKRQRSISFALDSPGLIRGLGEGIEGMKAGGTRRLEIPWMLGYGKSGRDPVPPKTDLVYEIELLRIHSSSTNDEPEPKQ